jgi:thiol:disulfide interchange protein DsbC
VKKINYSILRQLLVLSGILFLLSMAYTAHAYKIEGCGADCKACHKLKEEEASKILKDFKIKVLKVEFGPIKGLWQISVEQDGKTFPIYLHYSKKYVFTGDIIDIKTQKALDGLIPNNGNSNHQVDEVDFNSIPLGDALVMGSKDAKNKVVVFTDPDCPFCAKIHKELKKIISSRKDIAFYIKLYPLPMHPDAKRKSEAIICEKSLKLLDDAFAGRQIPSPKCKTNLIEDNINFAMKIGIQATPTMILKDSSTFTGYRDANSLIKLIDSAK